MKIKLIGTPKIIMSNFYSKHNYFAWPTVARFHNGKIIVGASGFRLEHVCPFGKTVVSYSFDNGNTYTMPAPVIDTSLDDRDAGICLFGMDGVIITSFNNSADMQRGYNKDNEYCQRYIDGITKDDEKMYLGSNFRISYDGGITFGEIYSSPVTSPHGPTQLSDGTIIWAGNNFINYSDGIEFHNLNIDSCSFDYIGKITTPDKNIELCEPHLIELPDGRLICHIRGENETALSVYQTVSDDKGKTWSIPERILDETGGAPPHLILLKSGLLVSTYGRRKQPYGIMTMISKDYGKTWEKDIRIYENTVSDDIGYPSTIELDNGELLTVFYSKEKNEEEPCVIMQQKWIIE